MIKIDLHKPSLSCLRTKSTALALLMGTCFLLALLLQMTSVAEDYRGSVEQCQELPSALLRRWRHGSVSLTPAEVDHVVSVIRTDLSLLQEVEDLLLEYGDRSLDSWDLLQEVRKHQVHLACSNQLHSTLHSSTDSRENEGGTDTKNTSRMDRPNEIVREDTIYHRYLDTADQIRKEKHGWADPRIQRIGSTVKEIKEMRREADHPSLASIIVNRKRLLSNFLVDDTNKYIYCYIPKVACTQWKKVMMLTARTSKKPFENITHNEAHYGNQLPVLSNLNKYSDTDVLQRLVNYTKFLVVRSPLERLVSAYQDKFLSDAYDTAAFKKNYARPMIKAIRGEDVKDGEGLLFKEFLKFLTSGHMKAKDFQEHWRPMYDLCHPCSIKYDYIAKFSTLEDDSNHILTQIMKGSSRKRIQFPKSTNSKTPHILEKYLDELDPSLLEAVKRTYRTDFEMFGY